jgi:hypothetical protein
MTSRDVLPSVAVIWLNCRLSCGVDWSLLWMPVNVPISHVKYEKNITYKHVSAMITRRFDGKASSKQKGLRLR